MRIAFYAPLKAPDHPIPSGDRRVARLLCQALAAAGHEVSVASRLRSFDGAGDRTRQARLAELGARTAARLLARYRNGAEPRPDLWFTYHLYHKAPDWLGPAVGRALDIPYVVAEASHAGKQAGGAWDVGHRAAADALARADLVLAMAERDLDGLQPLMRPPAELRLLRPFLDLAPFERTAAERADVRGRLACAHGLDPALPWLVTLAMMRPGDKLRSYRHLAAALQHVGARWQLALIGDGAAEPDVRAAFAPLGPDRVAWLGRRDETELADLLAAMDLFVWPGLNEAYGMAFLEAQAAGLPVVTCAQAGVPEVVTDGDGGRLVPADDAPAFGAAVRDLLTDLPARRAAGRRARLRMARLHGLGEAARTLRDALEAAVRVHAARRAVTAA